MRAIFFVFVSITFFSTILKAEKYAILVSAGKTEIDHVTYHSEYWYDLIKVYKDLIEHHNYRPENIFVFYGDGQDFQSSRKEYNTDSLQLKGPITDFPNYKATLFSQFEILSQKITTEDHLLIRWLVGHGDAERGPDDYKVLIENSQESIQKQELVQLIDSIKNYKSRKIIWMTCFSGSLTKGTVVFRNEKTVLITSSGSDEFSYTIKTPNSLIHTELNYSIWSLFNTEKIIQQALADIDNDGAFNFKEIYSYLIKDQSIRSIPQFLDKHLIGIKSFM